MSDARQASFMSFWRSRSRTLWKSAKPTGGHQHSGAAATEDKDADVQNEIKDLHHSAPRPKDASTIKKAVLLNAGWGTTSKLALSPRKR